MVFDSFSLSEGGRRQGGHRVTIVHVGVTGKLKTALHLKVHFGCWKAQKSEDEDDVLGKDTQRLSQNAEPG